MRFIIKDKKLKKYYEEGLKPRQYSGKLLRAFAEAVDDIDAALDRRDLYGLGFKREKLRGKLAHQSSLRLNRQMRLIIEFEEDSRGELVAIIRMSKHYEN